MKKLNLTLTLSLLVILFSCTTRETENKEADIAAINAFINDYIRHAENEDIDSFMTSFTDDAKRSEPGFPTIIGKENIRASFKGIFDAGDNKIIPYGEPEVDVWNDLAYRYTTVTLQTKPKNLDTLIYTDMKVLTILQRQDDGSWKIYIDCINFHPTLSKESVDSELLDEPNPYY